MNEISKLRHEVYRIYEEMPTEQPDIPQSLLDEAKQHKDDQGLDFITVIKPTQESWEDCYQRWMEQLTQAKKWIDITYRNVVAGKHQTDNDRLVISNCKDLIRSFDEAKQRGFMEQQ